MSSITFPLTMSSIKSEGKNLIFEILFLNANLEMTCDSKSERSLLF